MNEKPPDNGDSEKKTKFQYFEEYMAGDHCLLHLDSRKFGVELPEELRDKPSVTLKLSYKFQGSTEPDVDKIVTYLKFSGNYQKCVIPWQAIWGMTGEEGRMVWPDEVPKEVLIELAKQKLADLGKKFFKSGKKSAKDEEQKVIETNLVKGDPIVTEPQTSSAEKPSEKKKDKKEKRGSFLKRIK